MTPLQFSIFAIEIQQVIWLRCMKLAAGGASANVEAFNMVVEKVGAAQEAGVSLVLGKPMTAVMAGYRSKVRANLRRLRKGRT